MNRVRGKDLIDESNRNRRSPSRTFVVQNNILPLGYVASWNGTMPGRCGLLCFAKMLLPFDNTASLKQYTPTDMSLKLLGQ